MGKLHKAVLPNRLSFRSPDSAHRFCSPPPAAMNQCYPRAIRFDLEIHLDRFSTIFPLSGIPGEFEVFRRIPPHDGAPLFFSSIRGPLEEPAAGPGLHPAIRRRGPPLGKALGKDAKSVIDRAIYPYALHDGLVFFFLGHDWNSPSPRIWRTSREHPSRGNPPGLA